ncbi:RibD family protein [Bounagaea algeriensis]
MSVARATNDEPAVDAAEAWRRLLGVRTPDEAARAGLVTDGAGRWQWGESASAAADRLLELYLPLCLAGQRCTYAQLGQSLDGCIATRTGDAVHVTGADDREHLHRLRALADAVVVGADTVTADDPRLTVRACTGDNPVRVVLDPQGRVPRGRRVFTDGAAPTLWTLVEGTGASSAEGVQALHLPREAGGFAPDVVLGRLAELGLHRVLVEGGGVTVSRFLRADALHRLYVTVAPVLLGDGVPGLRFPGTPHMRDALRAPVRRFSLGADSLFELDLTGPRPVTLEQQHAHAR